MKRLIMCLIGVGLSAACSGAPALPAAPATSTSAVTVTATPDVRPDTPRSASVTLATTAVPSTALPTKTPPTEVPPTPTVTPTALTPPTLSPERIATYTAELSATVTALLPPPPTPDPSGYAQLGFEGVSVWPLTTTNGAALWVAYSYGLRDFIGGHNHFIAIYTHVGTEWQQLLKFDLENADYVDPASVRQAPIEPSHIWLEVDSGVGAHGGCFDLYAIDSSFSTPLDAATNCTDHPGAGEVRDLNGDGQLDVILDHTNSYVFCYACGVRLPSFSVLRWDGKQFVEQTLTHLPDSAPANLRQAVKRAIELANAGLWKDAQATIDPVATANPIAQWNAALIGLQAEALRDQITYQPYPLLDNLFYGDYAATLNVMRPYPPDQIFSLTGPLIAGTPAESWESTLADWITQTTNSAIQVQPNLAAAYFLRGYGEWLADQKNPAALADIEKAAALDLNEKLFSDSVEFLK